MRNKRPLSEEEFKEKIDRQNDRVCGLLINIVVSMITAMFISLLALKGFN